MTAFINHNNDKKKHEKTNKKQKSQQKHIVISFVKHFYLCYVYGLAIISEIGKL